MTDQALRDMRGYVVSRSGKLLVNYSTFYNHGSKRSRHRRQTLRRVRYQLKLDQRGLDVRVTHPPASSLPEPRC